MGDQEAEKAAKMAMLPITVQMLVDQLQALGGASAVIKLGQQHLVPADCLSDILHLRVFSKHR